RSWCAHREGAPRTTHRSPDAPRCQMLSSRFVISVLEDGRLDGWRSQHELPASISSLKRVRTVTNFIVQLPTLLSGYQLNCFYTEEEEGTRLKSAFRPRR